MFLEKSLKVVSSNYFISLSFLQRNIPSFSISVFPLSPKLGLVSTAISHNQHLAFVLSFLTQVSSPPTKMKQFTLILTCATALLSGVVSAHPGHDGPITIIRARDLNSTDSTNSTAIADDYVPDLQAAECVCPEPICDPRMNAQSVRISFSRLPPQPSSFMQTKSHWVFLLTDMLHSNVSAGLRLCLPATSSPPARAQSPRIK